MTINKVKGNNYGPNKPEKSNSVSKSSDAARSNNTSKSQAAGSPKNAATLSLSGSKFESELSFAKNILSNARQDSLASLKKIKQKINSGAYNNEAVHKEISSFIQSDLSSLEGLLSKPAESHAPSSPVLTAERREHLLENPEVTKKIADQIARQLKNF